MTSASLRAISTALARAIAISILLTNYAAAEVLPEPTRNAKPVRQTAISNCDVGSPGLPCRYSFLRVGDNRMLTIENISCYVDGLQFFYLLILNKDSTNATNPVGIIPAVKNGEFFMANVTGPYYFKAGEKVFLWSEGSTGRGTCTISGTISRTD